MVEKREPIKRKSWYPPGAPSPTVYPEGGEDALIWRESDFNPVKIRGKPLSDTVIEDRGPAMPAARDSEPESERPAIVRPPIKGRRNFNPVEIRGKPLSETVVEDRRAGW